MVIPKLEPEFVVHKIREMNAELKTDKNGRYRSWEHCFTFFEKNWKHNGDVQILDSLCLHLAFYLASWGMYRGSSFLLQKDYKVHLETVEVITNNQYQPLWNLKASDILTTPALEMIFDIKRKLNDIYSPIKKAVKPKIKNTDTTDTLITKIMMGTFGCVPAYDKYFQEGVKKYKIAGSNFTETSVKSLAKFYLTHEEPFEQVRSEISKERGVEYPQMKLIDMCFWQIGKDMK